MQKLFQKLIMMQAYFMRKVSSLNIYSGNLKNQVLYVYPETYSLPWSVTTTEYNCKTLDAI